MPLQLTQVWQVPRRRLDGLMLYVALLAALALKLAWHLLATDLSLSHSGWLKALRQCGGLGLLT